MIPLVLLYLTSLTVPVDFWLYLVLRLFTTLLITSLTCKMFLRDQALPPLNISKYY